MFLVFNREVIRLIAGKENNTVKSFMTYLELHLCFFVQYFMGPYNHQYKSRSLLLSSGSSPEFFEQWHRR